MSERERECVCVEGRERDAEVVTHKTMKKLRMAQNVSGMIESLQLDLSLTTRPTKSQLKQIYSAISLSLSLSLCLMLSLRQQQTGSHGDCE